MVPHLLQYNCKTQRTYVEPSTLMILGVASKVSKKESILETQYIYVLFQDKMKVDSRNVR